MILERVRSTARRVGALGGLASLSEVVRAATHEPVKSDLTTVMLVPELHRERGRDDARTSWPC